jgi:flavin reductase (DIM6/NTAB) family NADH-FMN oxidoreductase RutF
MNKIQKKPSTALAPVPVVMVSCDAPGFHPNIITIAWAGTLCSDPPLVGIGVRRERWSHAIITASGEFVVNIPNQALVRATDFCGIVSGRERDKFAETGLTPVQGQVVQAPLIAEAPVNLECRVTQILPLGSHDLFIGEIVAVHVAETAVNAKGVIDLGKMEAVAYGNGHYYPVGPSLATFGFSEGKP